MTLYVTKSINPLLWVYCDIICIARSRYSCNFCALTGTVPDIFANFPDLLHTFWDGNALSGSLPSSLGSPNLKKLCCVSFDINRMSGAVPPGLCDLPALNDCRIGADVDPGSHCLSSGNGDFPMNNDDVFR